MRSWALLLTCLTLAGATMSPPVLAQQRPQASEGSAGTAQTDETLVSGRRGSGEGGTRDEQRKAQEHFQRAKELYSTGKYPEAIAELEVARGLDPKAKDLVLNIAI